ncbi:MAG: VanW family protein [Raoultibacter sp.]
MSELHRKSIASKRRRVPTDTPADGRRRTSSSRKAKKKPTGSRQSSKSNSTYNKPHLWTKNTPQPTNPVVAGFKAIGSGLLFLLTGIGGVIRFLGGSLFNALRKNRIALVVAVLLAVALLGGALDTGMNWGKVYPGVKVGMVDLGGKSVEEAEVLLSNTYTAKLNETSVTVYAGEDNHRETNASETADENLKEQQSVEEVRAEQKNWKTDASQLQATYDSRAAARQALEVGRDSGGFIQRLNALFFGVALDPEVDYVSDALEAFAQEIDKSIGDPRVDYSLSITQGNASVVMGHDGYMVDRATLQHELNMAFLQSDTTDAHCFTHVDYAPLRIDAAAAQATCDVINAAIAPGADFSFKETVFHADATLLGSWVQTRIVEKDAGNTLEPFIDTDKAAPSLIDNLKVVFTGENLHLEFVESGDDISVRTNSQETMPQVQGAIEILNTLLFEQGSSTETVNIPVEEVSIPNLLSLDDALSYGLVTCFADYTTEYTAGIAGRNHNIHLAADLLNNSIIKSGSNWSFNDIAGNCNEKAGFQAAGSIVDGEYTDEIGGGICQVATTVFNAVYNAGFPVVQRHNHSLYIASYPAGRDAAVSYPDLDLVWKNDSASDVLFQMSYTDTTVVAKLYGVNPEYSVETTEGEWTEGAKFKTKTIENDTMQQGASYIKTSGADGRKITIIRTVKDKNGALLHEDIFESQYDPKDEVKVVGVVPKTTETSVR